MKTVQSLVHVVCCWMGGDERSAFYQRAVIGMEGGRSKVINKISL
jgi:hypothetical protein